MNNMVLGHKRKYAVLIGLLLTLWFWVPLYGPYNLFYTPWNIGITTALSSPTRSDAFNFPAVDSEAIKSICSGTEWDTAVVFTCDNSVGGIGNIRNSILNCVRYAILAGGSLVVPRIIIRNPKDIAHIRTGERTEFEYMFDRNHFVESLRLSCPQLRVYETLDEVTNRQRVQGPLTLLPESLVDNIPKDGLTHPEEWRGAFDKWLGESIIPTTIGPTIIELERSYLQYPIYTDGEGFALNFGSILKFRSDVRRLATTTLLELSRTFFLPIDIRQPFIRKAFMGAHLRTEKDATEGWPAPDWIYSRYETQSRCYLEQASASKMSLIYVASGNRTEVSKFTLDAQVFNISITTKYGLLKGKDREELDSLAWDQQALVDFLVMLKASDFAGIGHSSFAWNIALKRHQYAQKKDHLDGPQLLSDELSQIYGLPRQYPEYAACLWP